MEKFIKKYKPDMLTLCDNLQLLKDNADRILDALNSRKFLNYENLINIYKDCAKLLIKSEYLNEFLLKITQNEMQTNEQQANESEPLPLYVNKIKLAKIIGVDHRTIDVLIRENTFQENIHFKKLTRHGNPVFYVQACIDSITPNNNKGFQHVFKITRKR